MILPYHKYGPSTSIKQLVIKTTLSTVIYIIINTWELHRSEQMALSVDSPSMKICTNRLQPKQNMFTKYAAQVHQRSLEYLVKWSCHSIHDHHLFTLSAKEV